MPTRLQMREQIRFQFQKHTDDAREITAMCDFRQFLLRLAYRHGTEWHMEEVMEADREKTCSIFSKNFLFKNDENK